MDKRVLAFGELVIFISCIVIITEYNQINKVSLIQSLVLIAILYLNYQNAKLLYPDYLHYDKREFIRASVAANLILATIFVLTFRVIDQNLVVVSLPEPEITRSLLFNWTFIFIIIFIIVLWILKLRGKLNVPEYFLVIIIIATFTAYIILNHLEIIEGSLNMGVLGETATPTTEDAPLFDITEATALLDLVIRELLLEPVISLTIVLMVMGVFPRTFPGANPAFRWFGNISISFLPSLIWTFTFLKIIPVPNSITVAFGGINLAFFAWVFWWLIVALLFTIIGTVIRMLSETGE